MKESEYPDLSISHAIPLSMSHAIPLSISHVILGYSYSAKSIYFLQMHHHVAMPCPRYMHVCEVLLRWTMRLCLYRACLLMDETNG